MFHIISDALHRPFDTTDFTPMRKHVYGDVKPLIIQLINHFNVSLDKCQKSMEYEPSIRVIKRTRQRMILNLVSTIGITQLFSTCDTYSSMD